MNETAVFEKFIAGKGLKHSKPRASILAVFLSLERHITAEELWTEVKRKFPSVGYATVYRTLKLLCEGGLCRALSFEDGATRYEHLYGHEHHDHIVCTKCGTCIEVMHDGIERLQNQLMKRHGFIPQYHRMNLFGICKRCAGKKTALPRRSSARPPTKG
jgi:Fur family transcriptional regulator, ferric uptake regulator